MKTFKITLIAVSLCLTSVIYAATQDVPSCGQDPINSAQTLYRLEIQYTAKAKKFDTAKIKKQLTNAIWSKESVLSEKFYSVNGAKATIDDLFPPRQETMFLTGLPQKDADQLTKAFQQYQFKVSRCNLNK